MRTSSGIEYQVLNALLCEDARKDKLEKDILIGVFSGNISVSEFPANIPLAVWLNLAVSGAGKDAINVRLTCPGRNNTISGRFELEKKEAARELISVSTPTALVNLKKPGKLRFQIQQASGRWKTVLSKDVSLRSEKAIEA